MDSKDCVFLGIGVSPGFAIGKPVLIEKRIAKISKKKLDQSQVEQEVQRFKDVIQKCRQELKALCKSMEKECTKESRAILESQILLLEDHSFLGWVHQEIVQGHRRAESAFFHTVKAFEARFARLDPFFQERFKDFQMLTDKILESLQSSRDFFTPSYPQGAIVFVEELSAFDVAEGIKRKVAAFVTARGGATSHACIMARAQKIPVVTAVEFFRCSTLMNAAKIAVDGTSGKICECSDKDSFAEFDPSKSYDLFDLLSPALTIDGTLISLSANIDSPSQAEEVFKSTNARIGLFRSEFAFLGHKQFPSEAIQLKKYTALVEAMKGREVVIRTFDVGGDKCFFQEIHPTKQRSFKFFLKEQKLFTKQVRAILRASLHGKIKILLPMITCLEDFVSAKRIIQQEAQSLAEAIETHVNVPPIGAMVETPSAAIISDFLAKEADFLSVGTNDLVQYCLAIDRQDHVFRQFRALSHPSIIRLIKTIVDNAKYYGTPVSICGEMASDPRFTALLLGLGVDDLSISLAAFPDIKTAIHSSSMQEAKALAEKVLKLSNSDTILETLNAFHEGMTELVK